MPGSSGVYLGTCFGYRLLNIAKLEVPYRSSEFQTVCCVLPESTSLVALTSCNIEAVEKHSSVTITALLFLSSGGNIC